ITGFDAGDFVFDTSGFANGKLEWSIDAIGSDLVLSAVFVPEPSSTALLGLGLSSLLLRRKRS
ncbi:MAG: PEP-CTERM sorting domain-containing protein, partial [Verrucomicrobiaceae bacterium]|nr:PEP-CTERM sorting domain-containing protein [Verrucomicrobiaceae bacterium]